MQPYETILLRYESITCQHVTASTSGYIKDIAATYHLSDQDIRYISQCLMKDSFNLPGVALHLRDLILYDFPDADTSELNDMQFVIAGS